MLYWPATQKLYVSIGTDNETGIQTFFQRQTLMTSIGLPSEQVVKEELDAFERARSHHRIASVMG